MGDALTERSGGENPELVLLCTLRKTGGLCPVRHHTHTHTHTQRGHTISLRDLDLFHSSGLKVIVQNSDPDEVSDYHTTDTLTNLKQQRLNDNRNSPIITNVKYIKTFIWTCSRQAHDVSTKH